MSQTLKQLSSSQGNTEQVAVFIGTASSELLQQLNTWVARDWLRALDCALAKFILEQDPQAQASVLLAAAMTSHQLGRGHACLDLAATLAAPDFVLSLPPEARRAARCRRNGCMAWMLRSGARRWPPARWSRIAMPARTPPNGPWCWRGSACAPLLELSAASPKP